MPVGLYLVCVLLIFMPSPHHDSGLHFPSVFLYICISNINGFVQNLAYFFIQIESSMLFMTQTSTVKSC